MKCFCGKEFEQHHHSQVHCSPVCTEEANRIRAREHYQAQKKRGKCSACHIEGVAPGNHFLCGHCFARSGVYSGDEYGYSLGAGLQMRSMDLEELFEELLPGGIDL